MEVSRDNHTSLVITMRQSGHNRVNLVQEHNLLQLKLMEAIKKADRACALAWISANNNFGRRAS